MPNPISVTEIPPNGQYIRRFGINSAVGTSYAVIDETGAAKPYMPSTPLKFEALSSSANDTAAGSGAHTILVTGIDSNWNLLSETITLNGLTPVQSVNTYYRVTKVEVMAVGSYGGTNAGTITVRGTGGGTTFVIVSPSYGQSFSSHFCVPAGFYGAIAGANLSTDSGKIVDIQVRSRDNANNTASNFHPDQIAQYFAGVTGTNHYDYTLPILVSPYTDVYITGKTASGTAVVSVEYWGYIAPL